MRLFAAHVFTSVDEDGSRVILQMAPCSRADSPSLLTISTDQVARTVLLDPSDIRQMAATVAASLSLDTRDKRIAPLVITAGATSLRLAYENRGEPFREGLCLSIESAVWSPYIFPSYVFWDGSDLAKLNQVLAAAVAN